MVDKWTFSTNLVASTRPGTMIPAIVFGPWRRSAWPTLHNEINRVVDWRFCAAFYAMLPYSLEAHN